MSEQVTIQPFRKMKSILSEIVAGDTVIVGYYARNGDGVRYELRKVDRVTATQIVLELPVGGDTRYRKSNGEQVGAASNVWAHLPWIMAPLQPVDRLDTRTCLQMMEEVMAVVSVKARQAALHKAICIKLSADLPVSTLEALAAILADVKPVA